MNYCIILKNKLNYILYTRYKNVLVSYKLSVIMELTPNHLSNRRWLRFKDTGVLAGIDLQVLISKGIMEYLHVSQRCEPWSYVNVIFKGRNFSKCVVKMLCSININILSHQSFNWVNLWYVLRTVLFGDFMIHINHIVIHNTFLQPYHVFIHFIWYRRNTSFDSKGFH